MFFSFDKKEIKNIFLTKIIRDASINFILDKISFKKQLRYKSLKKNNL